MTQELEDKDLLLKDLSARLPYKLIVHVHDVIEYDTYLREEYLVRMKTDKITLKPYLRPMSSMTEEERKEYYSFIGGQEPYDCDFSAYPIEYKFIYEWDIKNYIDFVNAHYLDYRGLIPKGLAREAPESMYKQTIGITHKTQL